MKLSSTEARATTCAIPAFVVMLSLVGVLLSDAAQAARPGSEDAACDAIDLRYRSSPDKNSARELNFFMFDAASHGCMDLISLFLDQGASVKARDRYGNTPLLIAARKGHNTVIDLLIEHGADVHQKNLAGSNAVLRAVTKNRHKTVPQLLALGVDPDLPNSRGVTALTSSVYNGQRKITRALIEAGADPSITDASGKGPIVYAAGKGYLTLVQLMYATGKIDINTRYGNDLTVLMWAAGHSNDAPEEDGLATVLYILEQGADIDLVDNRQKSALMIAAERGHAHVVELLLKKNANQALQDTDGKDALALASSDEVKALLSAR